MHSGQTRASAAFSASAHFCRVTRTDIPRSQSGLHRSPPNDSGKREFCNDCVETGGRLAIRGFDSGTLRDFSSQRSPPTAASIRVLHVKIAETVLVGWRRSADAPLLCRPSQLTGNFTGNFSNLGFRARQRLQIVTSAQGVVRKFPTQRNRELFWRNREI